MLSAGGGTPSSARPSSSTASACAIGQANGPLLDAGITIESVALHMYAEFGLTGVTGGGAQIELTGLAFAPTGASGANGIAAVIVSDTGPQPPQPAFSPALAIQQHGDRTGRGHPARRRRRRAVVARHPAPLGPLYLEQVGFGTAEVDGRVASVTLLFDGRVAIFGLTGAVDELQITYLAVAATSSTRQSGRSTSPGLAVSADLSGISLAGGMLKTADDR